jgi:nucleotide-binding universal stress UspA family protein
MTAFSTILHPTDFSDASMDAFAHALRIALAARASLFILHVEANPAEDADQFPRVRTMLAEWGLMNANEPISAIHSRLGIRVAKADVYAPTPAEGVTRFLERHPADLIVLATEARQGLARLLHGSTAERLAREAKTPALFVPAKAQNFVDPKRGEVRLRRVLIPVDYKPKPVQAVGTILRFAHLLGGISVDEKLLHIGKEAPAVPRHGEPERPIAVTLRHGDPVERILEVANDWRPDLIGMATAGHRSVLDALRGSTTERVLRQAPCPVLTVPAAG